MSKKQKASLSKKKNLAKDTNQPGTKSSDAVVGGATNSDSNNNIQTQQQQHSKKKTPNKQTTPSANSSEVAKGASTTSTPSLSSQEQAKHRENVIRLTKDLAATDEGIRTSATGRFIPFLKDAPFNKLDLETNFVDFRKLWKGGLYGFWLCDGEFKQHEMGQLLAECIHSVKGTSENPHELPIAFLRAFFDELFETWPRLDRYRMDKYLMLVRKVMQQAFVCLNKTFHYKPEVVEEFIDFILEDGVFNNEERNLLSSLQIHVAELFFLELVQYGGPQVEDDSDYHLNEDALMKFITFFVKNLAETKNNSIIKTYREDMFDLLLEYQITQYGNNEEESADNDEMQDEEGSHEENGQDEDVNEEDANEDDDDEDDDLPVDEFGRTRHIVKDRPLPINIERIVKEFEKYIEGYEHSDVCKEYYEKFKIRIITLDDLYSELEQVSSGNNGTSTSEKKDPSNKNVKDSPTSQRQNSQTKESKKTQKDSKQPQKKESQKQEKKPATKKQLEQKAAPVAEDKMSDRMNESSDKQETTPKQQEEQQNEKTTPKKDDQSSDKSQHKLEKIKNMKKKLAELAAAKEEKKVKIDLNKNQVKTFSKKDIVPSVPVDLTFSPTKGLLKRKQSNEHSPSSLNSSEQKVKKRK
ncbi:hypothetical protein FDP41_005107 [Naegleria fowleri]|uniref:Uncharacterized protein n=1 Tax=Naegleria fowleri TaxID=5763 RepID=A0A6A5BPC7_NAEFO|nr:uncharacterized protein FDP41_005107 [Naegleria fowleri]KAF0975780.1 hypothetical protein FDP41_005107 [Naegleria fowleri]CAG4707828.1 unnamed protein product [Naegleria fowleri]